MEMGAALAAAVLHATPTVAAPRQFDLIQALDLVIGIGQFALRRDQIPFSLIELSLDLVELAGAALIALAQLGQFGFQGLNLLILLLKLLNLFSQGRAAIAALALTEKINAPTPKISNPKASKPIHANERRSRAGAAIVAARRESRCGHS